MKFRVRGLLAGLTAAGTAVLLSAPEITAQATDQRTISLYNIHTKETVSVVYRKNGQYVPAAMKQVNHAMRDWRQNETTEMDPGLVDVLWEVHQELGSKEPIHLISAFRSRKTNDNLRENVGGQAKNSRHILGKAADVHFPDVPIKRLRYSALIRERGGVGYYPTSAIPFVHIDTDRVRHWPPMPRYELALLFPNGHSKHIPSDGQPITKEDVRVAQSRHKDLAVQIAEFFDVRQKPGSQPAQMPARTVLASLSGPFPVAAPTPPAKPAAEAAPARTQMASLGGGVSMPLPAAILKRTAPASETAALPPVAAQPPRAQAPVQGPGQAPTAPAAATQAPAKPAPSVAKASDPLGALLEQKLADLGAAERKAAALVKKSPKPAAGMPPAETRHGSEPAAAAQTAPAEAAAQTAAVDPPVRIAAPPLASALASDTLDTVASDRAAAPQAAPVRVASADPKAGLGDPIGDKISGEILKGWPSGYAQAPAFDEEHPEELSYRPFAIGPILTQHIGHDHPVLARMQAPDNSRLFEMLDEPERLFPLSFRPGKQVAELMWAGQFNGAKVGADTLMARLKSAASALIIQRQVPTTFQR